MKPNFWKFALFGITGFVFGGSTVLVSTALVNQWNNQVKVQQKVLANNINTLDQYLPQLETKYNNSDPKDQLLAKLIANIKDINSQYQASYKTNNDKQQLTNFNANVEKVITSTKGHLAPKAA
ncbi:hypothetical protein ACJA23_02035 [Mycoplasma corogypsi]|uniref:hypothetical protein n=1 Tax=Mycoplasma corogypsi TaxID=2106 RepID=UPI003873C599